MCVCACALESVGVLFFKSVGMKVAAGLCGLVTSSSVNWLGFRWTDVKLHLHTYEDSPAKKPNMKSPLARCCPSKC